MPLTFRPARPDDVETAVPLIYSSGPAAFDYVFRHPVKGFAQDFLREAFVRDGSQFSYQQHWVGELDGKLVATGTAFTAEKNLSYMLLTAWQILRFYGPVHCWRVFYQGLQMEQLIPPPPKGPLYIGHLGVLPGLTGQGIGTQLVEHLLQQGRARGLSSVALDVSAQNPLAQALYERLGFCVLRERVSRIRGVADHRYMEGGL